MEELVHKGLCKAIGVSNFSSTKVKALLETAEIVPATNQGEYFSFVDRFGAPMSLTILIKTALCTVPLGRRVWN